MAQRIGIDIGGTFTDMVAIATDGRVVTHKIASTPHDYGDGIVDGLRALLASHSGTVTDVLHGTTIGSNTILEGKGARTALITTQGLSRHPGDPRPAHAGAVRHALDQAACAGGAAAAAGGDREAAAGRLGRDAARRGER